MVRTSPLGIRSRLVSSTNGRWVHARDSIVVVRVAGQHVQVRYIPSLTAVIRAGQSIHLEVIDQERLG